MHGSGTLTRIFVEPAEAHAVYALITRLVKAIVNYVYMWSRLWPALHVLTLHQILRSGVLITELVCTRLRILSRVIRR